VDDDLIVGLDIGTSKVCATIAEINDQDKIEIIGIGYALSNGLRAGIVINIESTIRAIRIAIEEAEASSGKKVTSLYTNISGAHIEGINSRGVVAVSEREKGVSKDDINRVLEAAKAIMIPPDREIIHVIPQEYKVDDQGAINDPIDMIGVRLEAKVHIIITSASAAQNLMKCINGADYGVNYIFSESLVSSKAVMSQDEKELGSLLINIGSGTSDIIIYKNGAPLYTTVLPYGAGMVTNDLSILLKIPLDDAEKLKIESGCCYQELLFDDDENIIVKSLDRRNAIQITKLELCYFIQPRMHEILSSIKNKIENESGIKNWKSLGGGIIITGGGSQLPGCVELATDIFGINTRIGMPMKLGNVVQDHQYPEYSTSIGLILAGLENEIIMENNRKTNSFSIKTDKTKKKAFLDGLKKSLIEGMTFKILIKNNEVL